MYETAVFTVPSSVPDERVQFVSNKYMVRAGHQLENQGFQVLSMTRPVADKRPHIKHSTPPDRRAYIMYAAVRRRPETIHIDVPDNAVKEMQATGMKLQE